MVRMKKQRIKWKINNAYRPMLDNFSRYEIIYGGAGSGKSFFAAQRLVYRALGGKKQKFLVVRKVGRTNRHSTFDLIQAIIAEWGLKPLFKINRSDMEILCHNGNRIIFSGLDDVEKLKSIFGITSIWVEEASEISREDFQQLDLRLRGSHQQPLQITLTFNPVSALSWLKSFFFDHPKPNTMILKTTYLDNQFLDAQYKEVLENLKDEDETFHQIYALGEWGTLGHLIYPGNWSVETKAPDSFPEKYWGLDFGFNNPTALLEVAERDGETWILSELYRSELTNSDLLRELKARVKHGAPIYADSAEPARIEEINRAGFLIFPADKDVRAGIDLVKRKRLRVLADCQNTVKELNGYSWKKNKDGVAIDEPVKFNDHAMDALRYAIFSHAKKRGETPRIRKF